MTLPDPAVREKVKQWLSYADEDLRVARHSFSIPYDPPFRAIAFHAQQCAEKTLNAHLVFHLVDFPYTHDLAELLEICASSAPWANQLLFARELTAYAVTVRYPGEDLEVEEQEARRAIEIAEKVRETVTRSLREEGLQI